MKKCIRCGKELPISNFNKDSSKKDGLSSYCRSCMKEKRDVTKEERNKRRREYYKLNRNHVRDQNRKYQQEHKDEIRAKRKERYCNNRDRELAKRSAFKEKMYALKTPCVKCGESRPWVIQFHHKDYREKKFDISKCAGRSEESVLDEIDKCVCLCSNCHDEFHYFYGDKSNTPLEDLSNYLGKNPDDI